MNTIYGDCPRCGVHKTSPQRLYLLTDIDTGVSYSSFVCSMCDLRTTRPASQRLIETLQVADIKAQGWHDLGHLLETPGFDRLIALAQRVA